MCMRGDQRVIFTDTALTCPAWSTFASEGAAQLDVDAAFLGFWGCFCPPDQYWGYGSLEELDAAAQQLAAAASLGEQERVLSGRRCLACPTALGVKCSALAVVSPPHVLLRSVYPFLRGVFERARLPYLPRDRLVACLHPAVCDASTAADYVNDWAAWSAMTEAARNASSFTEFKCRQGHRVDAPLCSLCEPGYWLDGFLCTQCFAGEAALVVVGLLAGAAVLVFVLHKHNKTTTADATHESDEGNVNGAGVVRRAGVRARHNYAVIVLWFFQVNHALQMSLQVNAAQSQASAAVSSAQGSAAVATYLGILSFRPWAIQCLVASWSYESASAALFAAPWAVGALAAAVPRWRRSCVLLGDLIYLPVAQRATEWFNRRALPDGQVALAAPPAHARIHSLFA
jgi:hypothetical protein